MAARLLLFLTMAAGLFGDMPARAQQDLVADLSDHLVAITTGFTGADVLLFGAVEGEGEIVVTVTGPRGDVTVRRKERVVGVWANVEAVTFANVPAFYAVAATKPLESVATPDIRQRQQIGIENVAMVPDDAAIDAATAAAFRAGLIRNKRAAGLYADDVLPVTVLSNRLFRTRIHLPANVAIGTYTVAVYYLRDGSAVHAQTTPLVVSKTGIGADIFLFAHTNSAAYGVLAIIIAVAAGWLAAWIGRKVG
ncbi:MAG: TIGR02186 family protein [Alphaproteobacteria bacterium]|nr:TIGR02186 family protein [Alphaproteobacteria bacterium]